MGFIFVLTAAVLFLAYANGANDNIKATATVYGSNTLSYRGALGLATASQVLGSLASIFLAGELLKAFGGKGLLPDNAVANMEFLVAVGLAAAVTVVAATRAGLPVSTTHALIGGLVGAGLAIAPRELAWSALGGTYFLPLLISPVLAVAGAAVLYPITSRARRLMRVEPSSRVEFEVTERVLDPQRDGTVALAYEGTVLGVDAQRITDTLHISSAFALGFARSLNDTPKVLGVLVAANVAGMDPQYSLLLVAVAMMIGGLLHSKRLAQTMGKSITTMNTGQGLLANATSSAMVIGASLLGSPVSTTHVSNGTIIGIGVWTGRANWKRVSGIVAAWVGTLPIACGISYTLGTALSVV